MKPNLALLIICLLTLPLFTRADAAPVPTVSIFRLPGGGVQPQAAVDDLGGIHLIYLAGDPSNSDIFYIHSSDEGKTFSQPLRVNSGRGSAIAMGTVRGAHLALGRGGRVHVAWMGSGSAEPKFNGKFAPMLYTRLADDGLAFEPQRNVIQNNPGLDGGGSIAADKRGNVYVAWHAPAAKTTGEQARRVWLARSANDGKTFSAEQAISPDTGACGCCGMRLFARDDGLYALYRTADHGTHRDMTLLRLYPDAPDKHGTSEAVGRMEVGACVMSTAAFAANPTGGIISAWETKGQIFWSPMTAKKDIPAGVSVPGNGGAHKHPAAAASAAGQVLIAWTEGTAWNKGGSIAWTMYDADGTPAKGGGGNAAGLPAWGAPAAFSRSDGSFVVVY